MSKSHRTALRSFVTDAGGNFTMMFALTAPLLIGVFTIAFGYSQTVTLNQEAQASADAAALAATAAIGASIEASGSMTPAQAETIATNYFIANAPPEIVAGQTTLSATTTVTNGVVTTTLNYVGIPNTMVSGILGSALTVDVTAVSSETITSTTTTPTGKDAGTGYIYEDPVVQGANGDYWFMDTCDVSHATWYNMLSDTNIEINANCDGNQYQSELYQFTVLVGTHVISVTPQLNAELWDSNPVIYINQEAWTGAVTVDGVSYAAPTQSGTTSLVNDQTNNVTVNLVVGQPGVIGSSANYILVKTANYSITIAYDSDDDGSWNFGLAAINFSATNAGACGTPGGVWGQTLSTAGNDSNFGDFSVASSTTKTSQFSRTCSTTTVSNTMPIITR